ncbi:MAG: hypothetical protein AAGF97_02485, partial [Planctomycetota bacterium]
MGIKLNLGCGENKLTGYVNVDMHGEPDVRHDLEQFPWPWDNDSVEEVQMVHVLEHLGQLTDVYIGVIKELYRVCQPDAKVRIVVPHHRHDNFHADPTHVRPITNLGLLLFCQRMNREWIENGAANSPLGIYHEVDFEITRTTFTPSQVWLNRYPNQQNNVQLLLRENNIYNNLIEQVDLDLKVIKPAGSSDTAPQAT